MELTRLVDLLVLLLQYSQMTVIPIPQRVLVLYPTISAANPPLILKSQLTLTLPIGVFLTYFASFLGDSNAAVRGGTGRPAALAMLTSQLLAFCCEYHLVSSVSSSFGRLGVVNTDGAGRKASETGARRMDEEGRELKGSFEGWMVMRDLKMPVGARGGGDVRDGLRTVGRELVGEGGSATTGPDPMPPPTCLIAALRGDTLRAIRASCISSMHAWNRGPELTAWSIDPSSEPLQESCYEVRAVLL